MIRVLIQFLRKKGLKGDPLGFKIAVFFFFLLWYAASGYLFFEMEAKPDLTWSDTIWWALVTMTTVGYGDFFPETPGGRFIIGIPTMILGIGFLGYILSEVASKLIESKSRRLHGMADINFTDHIIIVNFIHLQNLLSLIKELKLDPWSAQKRICLIDESLEELPPELDKIGVVFIKGNPTMESTLKRACIDTATHAIVLSKDPNNIHSDDQNLATILMIEDINSEIITVAECINPEKVRQMIAAGCDRIVCTSRLTNNFLVQEIQDPGIQNVISEITSNVYGQQLYIVTIENMARWQADELKEWARAEGFIVIGVRREQKSILNCENAFKIEKNDRAILLGPARPANINTA
ncbi:potassium channel family protein [Candidatus Riflebacteria bacterium]